MSGGSKWAFMGSTLSQIPELPNEKVVFEKCQNSTDYTFLTLIYITSKPKENDELDQTAEFLKQQICGLCNKFCSNLDIHMENIHNKERKICEICNKKPLNLQNHMDKYHKKKTEICEICNKSCYTMIGQTI